MTTHEALAKALDEALSPFAPQLTEDEARAVVAALADQGLVVVPREGIDLLTNLRSCYLAWLAHNPDHRIDTGSVVACLDQILPMLGADAALAAPGEGGDTT